MTSSHTEKPNAKRIRGAVGTGKTETLIDHAAGLLATGVSPSDIRVFCATPHAASACHARLTEKAGSAATGIAVTTPRAMALCILSSDEAQGFTGRRPRLLANFEYSFLMEDMKVSGIRPKRLKEMLKFLYRSWTELADDEPDWLIEEEVGIHALLKANLGFTKAMLEPEIANLAIHYLRSNDEALAAQRAAHVLVDDYQCLSKASQTLVNMLAEKSIVIAGDPCACNEVYDSYPYAPGFEEFSEAYPSLETVELTCSHLAESVTEVVNALLADDCMQPSSPAKAASCAPEGRAHALAFTSAEDEFAGIAAYCTGLLEAGMRGGDIHVAVPNRSWSTRIRAELADRGVKTDTLPLSQVLGGDIRDTERSRPLRLYTALKLAADPQDPLAWRSWCGYGDYLANSALFDMLRTFSEERELDMVAALELAYTSPEQDYFGFEKLVAAYAEGKALIEQAAGLSGNELLTLLAALVTGEGESDASIPAVISQLCAPLDERNTAEQLIARAEQRLIDPRFSFDDDAVKISSAEHLCGLSPKSVIFSGFVNGFIPDRDYFDATVTPIDKLGKIHAKDTRLVYATAGKAREDLAFTYFTKTDLESAEHLKLEIERIKLEKGVRVCVITPSVFLKAALPTA